MSKVQQRTVLWYLTFVGFAINYMSYHNLNITIVQMINSKLINSTSVIDKVSVEKLLFNWTNLSYNPSGFDWSEHEQGLVLGSYFWAHWITQIPGGILAMKYGTKLVFGASNLLACCLCFLMPLASYATYKALIVLRLFQGFITGFAWPAMHVMCAQWIPPNERSQFVTSYLGSSIGIAIFHPLFGYMMHWLSWEWVFHLCGTLGIIWWFAWQYFVYDSPAEHPRIQISERCYIEEALGSTVKQNANVTTPWSQIFTSSAFWLNVMAQWGSIWAIFTLMVQAPTYFHFMHNWNISSIGLLSGLPHLLRLIFAYVFSLFADNLLRTGKMQRTTIRKLATTFCNTFLGFAVLALAYLGYNSIVAAALFTLSVILQGAVSTGPLAALVDIAPNHAGILLGISSTIDLLPGFLSPHIVSYLTYNNQTFEAWQQVFLISAVMAISTGVLYAVFADANLQHWNDAVLNKSIDELELKPLRKLKNKQYNDKFQIREI